MSESKPVEEKKEPEEPAPAPAPSVAPTEPSSKQPTETNTVTKIATKTDSGPDSDHVGKRIVKKFDKKNFFGEIKEKWLDEKDSSPRWNVKYDDGDEEDFNEKELTNALKRYEKSKRFDYKIFPKKPRTPSKKRKVEPPPPRTNKFPKRGQHKE